MRAHRVVGGGLADPDQVLLGVLDAVLRAARLLDGLADRRVGRGGELVDAVRVEGRGDQLRALEGELEQLALGAVGRAAQVEGGAATGRRAGRGAAYVLAGRRGRPGARAAGRRGRGPSGPAGRPA